jgi:hypothetical protein
MIGQNSQHRSLVSLEERQYPIIEKISRGDRRLGAVELGKGYFRVSVDEDLQVDPANSLLCTYVDGDLGTEPERASR